MSLDLDAALAWLHGHDALRDDGAVMSWHNPAHPGYPYPEIAGLWLCAFPHAPAAPRVAAWLRAQVDAHGRIGRGEARYAFDAAVVIRGLRAHAPEDPCLAALTARLRDDLVAGRACVGGDARRWSTVPGPHLLKCAIALGRNVIDARAAVRASPQGLRFDDGTGEGRTYLHANLYALEGARWLAARGDDVAAGWCRDGLRWLASVQTGEGGLRAWHDGVRAEGPVRADATAQAVRLWCALDPTRYATSIARGRACLAAMQHPGGAMRYEPESEDQNVWATIFAVQAERWARGEAAGDAW
ncbi:MAG: hypothetical protein U0325_10365 [Polyangiales bacterium]